MRPCTIARQSRLDLRQSRGAWLAPAHAQASEIAACAGDALSVEFTVLGLPCLGLDAGLAFPHTGARSFQDATDDQTGTGRRWDAIIGHGGQTSACRWSKDRWGLSSPLAPRVPSDAIASADPAVAKRAFTAMTTIDIARIAAGVRGGSSQAKGGSCPGSGHRRAPDASHGGCRTPPARISQLYFGIEQPRCRP